MGNVTAKTSGDIASFMSPSMTNIKSLKVHFSPKQLGTGDPSPENIREIEGWDGIKIQFYNPITNLYVAKEQTISAFGLTFHVSEQNQNITINGTVSGVEGRRVNLFAIDGDNSTVFCSGFPKLTGKLSWSLLLDNDVLVDSLQDINGFSCQVETNKKLRFGIKIYSGEILSLDIHPIITKTSPISVDFNNTFYGGYVDLISGELVEDMRYKQITAKSLSNAGDYIGYTSSVTALDGQSAVWVRNLFNSTAKGRKSGGIKANCNAFKVLMNSTDVSSSQNRTAFAVDNETITNVADFISAVETLEQNDNGLYLAYELAEPITHQLTPTQLKSFVGQNNFWSNADYVEIEYELKETEDIQKARKKIILNQPQLKTISNKVVSFNTDMVAPMKNCKIYFKPIQLGSGDPSPTNVRNINGWTGLDSYVNEDKISVDWTDDAGTVYGGYVDLVKGEVVAEYAYISLSSLQWTKYEYTTSGVVSYVFLSNIFNRLPTVSPYPSDIFCDVYTIHSTEPISRIKDIPELHICGRSTYSCLLIKDGRYETAEDFITNITGNVVYKLAEPIHYPLSSLTSQQLLTLKSTNHIWSETNGQQIDVKYWTHKNLTPIPLTDYLENQTWTDSAYISSTGKKTINGTSASHFLTNQILLEAGTYVLSGFSHYVGTDNTNYRIHAYDSTGKWLRQITFQQIGNLSPVDISFTLDTDTYVNVSIAADFDGVLAKIN